MKRKIFGFLVCTLLITTIIPFSVTSYENEGSTIIYVDDDGTADYTRIQDAIDNASDGDTIIVMPGVYYETIVVDKSVKLIGQDKHATIIDGMNISAGPVFTGVVDIKAYYVEISGFTIRNIGEINNGILVRTEYNIIDNNLIISNNPQANIGICLSPHGYGLTYKQHGFNIVSNNTVSGEYQGNYPAFYNGIIVEGRKNTIENNIVSGNIDCGIRVELTTYSEIKGNIITKNENGIWIGIWIDTSFYNTISNNHIANNEIGIWSVYSSKNEIVQNNLIDNLRNALVERYYIFGFIQHFFILLYFGFHPFGRDTWDSNYYDGQTTVPHLIPTIFYIGGVPITYYLNFDWHPASEPYDIPIKDGVL